MICSTTWRCTRDVIYAEEGKDSSATRCPDRLTYAGQVNPFIVMKWGAIMHCECEMLNPVLAFLWGRSSHVGTDLERCSNSPLKHDADIAQHTLWKICKCKWASRQTPCISVALSLHYYASALSPVGLKLANSVSATQNEFPKTSLKD